MMREGSAQAQYEWSQQADIDHGMPTHFGSHIMVGPKGKKHFEEVQELVAKHRTRGLHWTRYVNSYIARNWNPSVAYLRTV